VVAVNRADRKRWASARTLGDLGELTAQWCAGDIAQTPAHCGGPAAETLPYLQLLAAVNRRGFVTTNSQAAGRTWNAWVDGFATPDTLSRLAACIGGSPLTAEAHSRGATREERYWYCRSCPSAKAAIKGARFIELADPQPGRNSLLWPALAEFAGGLLGQSLGVEL
jgi:hypothetical protein